MTKASQNLPHVVFLFNIIWTLTIFTNPSARAGYEHLLLLGLLIIWISVSFEAIIMWWWWGGKDMKLPDQKHQTSHNQNLESDPSVMEWQQSYCRELETHKWKLQILRLQWLSTLKWPVSERKDKIVFAFEWKRKKVNEFILCILLVLWFCLFS